MPTDAYTVDTVIETIIPFDDKRTVLLVQNVDAANPIFVGDEAGTVVAEGIRIAFGGNVVFRRAHGEEPEKARFILATGAPVIVHVSSFYGEITRPGGVPIVPGAPKKKGCT